MSGFAKGLMQKGFAIKDNMKEKAAVLNPQALQGIGSNLVNSQGGKGHQPRAHS